MAVVGLLEPRADGALRTGPNGGTREIGKMMEGKMIECRVEKPNDPQGKPASPRDSGTVAGVGIAGISYKKTPRACSAIRTVLWESRVPKKVGTNVRVECY